MDEFADVNGIKLHYLDHPGGEPPLVLLPGLTVNAHFFDGLVAAGLSPRFRTIAVDFRGRGLSDKPETGYSMGAHAADVVGLLDEVGIEQAVICGHSFGGLIGFTLAAQHPQRVSKLIILDSSPLLITERTRDMVKGSLERLGQTVPSMAAYLQAMKEAPYLDGFWDPALERYYRHDVEEFEDGSVQPLASPAAIGETIDAEFVEPWDEYLAAITQPALLINSLEPFGPAGAPPILPREMAQETVDAIANCQYVTVPGNHITMIFGDNAQHIVAAITEFVE